MTKTEPLRGSSQPARRPARLLGAEEVEHLLAMQSEQDEPDDDEEDDGDRRTH